MKSFKKTFVICLVLGLMLQGLCLPAFANDDTGEPAAEPVLEPTEEPATEPPAEPSEIEPSVHTVVSAWDVIQGREESLASGDKDIPAFLFKYIDVEVDEAIEAEIDRQIEEAEALAEKLASKEAKQLAEELVANGRYKEMIGEEDGYYKIWDDEEDDEDYGEDYGDEEDEDYDEDLEDGVEDLDEYYLSIAKKYPHILEFWFEEDGHYYYDYDADYDGIDFDSMYYEVPHDTFHVIDNLEYKDFEPSAKYTISARLLQTETVEGDTAEKIIKELKQEFTASEEGAGTLELDFGELKLDKGKYVITLQIHNEAGELYLEHNDLTNTYESIEVDDLDEMMKADTANNRSRKRGEGFINFPKESPDTGDSAMGQIPLYATVIMMCAVALINIFTSRVKRHGR